MENKYTAQELAAMLGLTLKDDPRYIALEAAQKKYETAASLHTAMTEYNVQQQAYAQEEAKDEPDTLLMASLQRRIEELYNIIIADPVFVELNQAQEEFNALMEEVNNILMHNLTGQDPSCTHDCSTCGGCGHSH